MNLIAWLAAGVVVGGLASMVVAVDGMRGLAMDIVAGLAGAWIGGQFFGPMLAGTNADPQVFMVTPFVTAVAGAVVLLIDTRMLRRAANQ